MRAELRCQKNLLLHHHFLSGPVQKRVNLAGLSAVFDRPAYKVDPCLVSKNLDLGGGVPPQLTDETVLKLFVQTIGFMLGVWNFGTYQANVAL